MKRMHVPIRTCRSCGKKAPKQELQRFVVDHGNLVDGDQGQGYGFYCCTDMVCRDRILMKLMKQKRIRADKMRGRE